MLIQSVLGAEQWGQVHPNYFFLFIYFVGFELTLWVFCSHVFTGSSVLAFPIGISWVHLSNSPPSW